MGKTINGVFNNINESDIYLFKYNMKFYFSSNFNKHRFEEKSENYYIDEELKIKNKYNVEIDLKHYLVLVLYKQIEKRGFKVIINNHIYNDIKELDFKCQVNNHK